MTRAEKLDVDDIGKEFKRLEKQLKLFQDEMNMKMAIVEQILNNRNDQFQVQQELLNRERTLYQSVLFHWKDIGNLASQGFTLQFSDGVDVENVEAGADVEALGDPDFEFDDLLKVERTSTSKARRNRAKQQRTKRMRTSMNVGDGIGTDQEEDDGSSHEDKETLVDKKTKPMFKLKPMKRLTPHTKRIKQEKENSVEVDSNPGDSDHNKDEPDVSKSVGLEKKVFSNIYDPEGGGRSCNPIWKHFLVDEGDKNAALCKHCDEVGVQTILRITPRSCYNLKRHISRAHPGIYDRSVNDDDGTTFTDTETDVKKVK